MRFLPAAASLLLLMSGACLPSAGAERSSVVALRECVDVNRENIVLSDLLPEQAEAALKNQGATIELGRAPQPGSLRVLDADEIARELANWPALLSRLYIPRQIVIQHSGWPIEKEQVQSAIQSFLRRKGSSLGALPKSAILRFADIGARQPAPALQVAAVAWDDLDQAVEFRLHCLDRSLCGSFLVRAEMPPSAADDWRTKLRPEAAAAQRRKMSAADARTGAALVERGKPATLILEGANLRISLLVTCLERGALSQQIRVFDASNRRVYRAAVVGAALLRATL